MAGGAFSPSLSREGTLTFIRRVWSEPRQLVIVNRAGVVENAIGEPQPGLSQPVLAPTGNTWRWRWARDGACSGFMSCSAPSAGG